MASSLKLIVGLGNPGQAYSKTRHNVGVWLIEMLAKQYACPLKLQTKFKAQIGQCDIHGQPLILAVPTTYMNESGLPVRAISQFYKIKPEEILVIHDELDLPAGHIKFKFDGGHGGHNGLRDIMLHIDSKRFLRLRIGIGKPKNKDEGKHYVLNVPPLHEIKLINNAIDNALIELPFAVIGELEKAMMRLHTDIPPTL